MLAPAVTPRGILLAVLALVSGCSSCESPSARPLPSVTASASVALPPQPAVALSAQVASQDLAAWPAQTKPFSAEQVAALLPVTEGGRIHLKDAGLEPREARRHQFAVGAAQLLDLELDLKMHVQQDTESGVLPVPSLAAQVELTTLDVVDSVARIQIEVKQATVRSREDVEIDADVMQQIEPLVKKLVGLRAILRVTAQGLRANTPAPPPDTPVELRQLWSTIGEAVTDAIIAFPAEPIGAGAQWVVLDRQQRAGVTMLRKTDMTLLDISDADLRLSGVLVEGAIAGSAQDPSLPKEITLAVLDGVTVGKRRHTLRAGELWPLSALTDLSSDLELRATATAGHFSDTKTSKVQLTQILRSVRSDIRGTP